MTGTRSARQALLAGIPLFLGLVPSAHSGPGDLEVRFGTHGQAEIQGQVNSAALVALPDGRILVFGVSPDPATRDSGAIAVARLLADGTPDTAFGPGGHRDVALGSEARPVPADALLLPDGHVLLGGYFAASDWAAWPADPHQSDAPGWLVRLSGDGSLDPAFGIHGVARAPGIDRIVRFADGGIAVSSNGLVHRLDSNGSPSVFPGSELAAVAVGTYALMAMVALQDGGLLTSGSYYSDSWELSRVSPSGTVQRYWGSTSIHEFVEVGSFARAPHDTRVTACGSTWDAAIVQRWRDDGTADPAYAQPTGGIVRLAVEQRPDFLSDYFWSEAHCRALLPDSAGGLVVVGDWNRPYEWGRGRILLAHLDASGKLDASLDPSGNGRAIALGTPDLWSIWYVADAASAPDGAALLLAHSAGAPTAIAPLGGGLQRNLITRVEISTPQGAGWLGFNDAAVRIAERKPGEVRVYRTGGSAGAVSVHYELLPGTAGATDVALAAGTLTWADGDASPRTVPLVPVDDDTMEGEESFRVHLSAATGGAELKTPEIEVTIEDDEALSALQFSQPLFEVKEGGSVDVTITRSAATGGPVVVHYAQASDLDPQGTPRPVVRPALLPRSPVGELRWSGDDTSSRTLHVDVGGFPGVQPPAIGYVVLADVAGTLREGNDWKFARINIVDNPDLGSSGSGGSAGGGGSGGASGGSGGASSGSGGASGGAAGGGGTFSLEVLLLLALVLLLRVRRSASAPRLCDAAPRVARAGCDGAAALFPPVPGSAGRP